MPDTTWEEGPWLVECKIRYIVKGCSSDTAVRAARALINSSPMPHGEAMPDIEEVGTTTTVYPEGLDPFTMERLEE